MHHHRCGTVTAATSSGVAGAGVAGGIRGTQCRTTGRASNCLHAVASIACSEGPLRCSVRCSKVRFASEPLPAWNTHGVTHPPKLSHNLMRLPELGPKLEVRSTAEAGAGYQKES
eukprot:2577830-Rhodomonas_salina.2